MTINFNELYDQFKNTPSAILPYLYEQFAGQYSKIELKLHVLSQLQTLQQEIFALYTILDSDSQTKLSAEASTQSKSLASINR